jgi:hypothetical protein
VRFFLVGAGSRADTSRYHGRAGSTITRSTSRTFATAGIGQSRCTGERPVSYGHGD